MEGNKPDDSTSLANSISKKDDKATIISGKVNLDTAVVRNAGRTFRGLKDGVTGQYMNFGYGVALIQPLDDILCDIIFWVDIKCGTLAQHHVISLLLGILTHEIVDRVHELVLALVQLVLYALLHVAQVVLRVVLHLLQLVPRYVHFSSFQTACRRLLPGTRIQFTSVPHRKQAAYTLKS